MSHAQAVEALETDVRDVPINLRARFVQDSRPESFPGRKVSAPDAGSGESNG